MARPHITLVTPALANANNGNWQTAARWARLLAPVARVGLTARWAGGDEGLMVALHARRSAASIAAWRAAHPARPLVVVLTGTDLYRDIDHDADAQRSLQWADALVVLNAYGAERLPPALRPRTVVVLQSCAARRPGAKTRRHLRVLMAGHLRDEKDPRCFFEAAWRLAGRHDIVLDHIGGALDPVLAAEARRTMAECPHYRWLGAVPHGEARRRIQAAHVLVNASRMEGGAQVVVEAMRSGTAVLASRIDGHRGLLDDGHPGFFAPGDAAGLATLIAACRDDPAMLPTLEAWGAARAPRFEPACEAAALQHLVASLLAGLPVPALPGPAPEHR